MADGLQRCLACALVVFDLANNSWNCGQAYDLYGQRLTKVDVRTLYGTRSALFATAGWHFASPAVFTRKCAGAKPPSPRLNRTFVARI